MKNNHYVLVEPTPPQVPVVPADSTPFVFGGFILSVTAILVQLGRIVNSSQKLLRFAAKVDPNLSTNVKFKFAQSLLETLDTLLPGDTSYIKEPPVVNYVSEHPELIAELIESTDLQEIKRKLMSLVLPASK
jgi:hypothetical protein